MSNHKIAIEAINSRITAVQARRLREEEEVRRNALVVDPPAQAENAQRVVVRSRGLIDGFNAEIASLEASRKVLEQADALPHVRSA